MRKENMETKRRNIKERKKERWIQKRITENMRERKFGLCFVVVV